MNINIFNFAQFAAGIIALIIFLIILVIAFLVFYFIGMWKLFVKAGIPGWKCLIPFYNKYVITVEMLGLNWYWAVLASTMALDIPALGGTLCSVCTVFAESAIAYNMTKKLGKGNGWFVLSLFFGFVTYPLAGYSSKTNWNSSAAVKPNAFFDKK